RERAPVGGAEEVEGDAHRERAEEGLRRDAVDEVLLLPGGRLEPGLIERGPEVRGSVVQAALDAGDVRGGPVIGGERLPGRTRELGGAADVILPVVPADEGDDHRAADPAPSEDAV